jgi:hypothetical protein
MFVGMANDVILPATNDNKAAEVDSDVNTQQHFCEHITKSGVKEDNSESNNEVDDSDGDNFTAASIYENDQVTSTAIHDLASKEISDFSSNYDSNLQTHPEFLRQFGKRMQDLAEQELFELHASHHKPTTERWLADSGATCQITNSDKNMSNVQSVSVDVTVGNGRRVNCTKSGDITISNGNKLEGDNNGHFGQYWTFWLVLIYRRNTVGGQFIGPAQSWCGRRHNPNY